MAPSLGTQDPFVETGFADVNGTRLYYEIRGAGPALLLAHGFGHDLRLWAPLLAELSQQHLVVCYDARGFGRSELPSLKPYRDAADAAALCDYLGVGPVLAVGHDSGAMNLLELSLERPDLVSGWISLCGTGLPGLALPSDLAQLSSAVRTAARCGGLDVARRLWQSSRWFRATRESALAAAALDEMLASYSGVHWLEPSAPPSVDPPASLPLSELAVPALVVTGERDLAYTDSVARALLKLLPDAAGCELPLVGHFPSLEDPDAVAELIIGFAARHARPCAPESRIELRSSPTAAAFTTRAVG